ncbi:hypothetical protein CDIK_1863 [Cucumispora dikerogammari]|nr:hypothetical protein CDIK_1863 [Cucumispora dikerogammari]
MNIMLKTVSLLQAGLTTQLLAKVLRLTKENEKEKQHLSDYLKQKNFIETIKTLKDISEVQLHLILFFKIIEINEIKKIKPFDELLQTYNKPTNLSTLTNQLKDILFKLTKYTTIKGFICERLELPTRTFIDGKAKIYLFFNEKNIKFLIDKEVVTVVYSTVKSYKIGIRFIELLTISKKVKINIIEYFKYKKTITVLLHEKCGNASPLNKNTSNKTDSKTQKDVGFNKTVLFEDKNTENGVSFKFVSDFNTETNFLNKLTNDFDSKSNHFFKKCNFLGDENIEETTACNTPNSSKLVDLSDVIDSGGPDKATMNITDHERLNKVPENRIDSGSPNRVQKNIIDSGRSNNVLKKKLGNVLTAEISLPLSSKDDINAPDNLLINQQNEKIKKLSKTIAHKSSNDSLSCSISDSDESLTSSQTIEKDKFLLKKRKLPKTAEKSVNLKKPLKTTKKDEGWNTIDLRSVFEEQFEKEKEFLFKIVEDKLKYKKRKYDKLRGEIEKYANRDVF